MVQEGLFCGVIIASYEEEPFAIMIPSFQLARDIRSVFPFASAVQLPGGAEGTGDFEPSLPS